MNKKQRTSAAIVVLLIALAAVLLGLPALSGSEHHNGLQLVSTAVREPNQNCLVVVTHGWIEKGDDWPQSMAKAISSRVDPNRWLCGYFDWSKEARTLNPADAARHARDVAGAALAEQILKLEGNLRHIHLLGHSSGCWAVSEAAKILARKTRADIHLTFFDAYVPHSMAADELADVNVAPDVNSRLGEAPSRSRVWADQYYTRDYTGEVTAQDLLHAHNVDLTETDQLIKDHNFPWKWYYATITGSFPKFSFMDDRKLVTDANGITYGFARSLEADPNAWQESIKLKVGNKAVELKPAQLP
jgi:hypothetical protein